ncbi:MAG: DUF6678 family protein [Capsulimonas sp.]|uniref:DUF6678 family protein n=1 Tax=Capsulimonas sp. TaxID=2494211 RepID=UPI0032646079
MNIHDQYRQKLWEIIERDYDGSRMNVMQWISMFDALRDLQIWLRIKLVDAVKVSNWTRRSGITYGQNSMPRGFFDGIWSPTLMLAIEWVELDPIAEWDKTNLCQEIERRLQAEEVPYSWEGPVIRITGHVRRSSALG